MRHIVFLTLLINLSACGTNPQESTTNPEDGPWIRAMKTASVHSYNANGYLDTTLQTIYIYQHGLLLDSTKSVTTRIYDEHNNLTREQQISLSKDLAGKVLSEEKYKYDKHNNVIEHTSLMGGSIMSHSKSIYNAQNQRIETVLVQLRIERNDTGLTDQEERRDTTFLSYELDQQGNPLKVITKDSKGNHIQTTYNKYKQRQVVASYTVTPNGDTTFISEVFEEGPLLRQVDHFKELSSTETVWKKGDKVVKSIARSTNPPYKSKHEHVYNEKGDEIEVTSYN